MKKNKTYRAVERLTRVDDRFIDKVKKGKKGTDMDIEKHERRLGKIAKRRGLIDHDDPRMRSGNLDAILGFTMPHSPLNQNDSIAASKAWQNFKQGYAKAGKVETGEYDREKHEFYYDTNKKKLRLVPTDDAERQDEGFKSNLKKWQLSPLNQNEKEVSDKRKTRLAEKVNKVKDNSPKGEKKFQRRLRKYEKVTGSKDWWANTQAAMSPLNQNEKVYNMTPNVSEKEAAGVREKFDRTYMKRGSHAHADSEFEKATYQLMNEGVIKETDNKSMPLIEKRMKENKRNK